MEDGHTYILFTTKSSPFDKRRKHEPIFLKGCGDQSDFSIPGGESKLVEVEDAQKAVESHKMAQIKVRIVKAGFKYIQGIKFKVIGKKYINTMISNSDGWMGHFECSRWLIFC